LSKHPLYGDPRAEGKWEGSKGPEYTLELEYDGPFTLSSSDVVLELEESGVLKAVADGYEYPLRSVSARDAETGRIWTNTTSSSHEPVKLRREGKITLKTDCEERNEGVGGGRFVGFVQRRT
jgi:hexosaminidase